MDESPHGDPPNGEQRETEREPWSPMALRLAWLAIAVGVMLRLESYLINRSLWLDEAMVSLNIANRSFAGLLTPLDYPTSAPILYLMLTKLATVLFGNNSYALRLVSLLAGVGSLPLFYILACACLSERSAVVAVTLFAFLSKLIYYSSDVKQYGVDAFVTLLILACTLPVLRPQDNGRPDRQRAWLTLGTIGVVSIWLAFPAIFVLVPVSGILVWRARQDGWRRRLYPTVVSVCWAVSFGLDYFLFLHKTEQMTPLVSFFVKVSMPGRASLLAWYSTAYVQIFQDEVRTYFPALAAVLSVIGAVWLIRNNRTHFSLVAGPIAVVGGAALLHKYPFQDRFMFFTVPLLIILLCASLEPILSAKPRFFCYMAYPLALTMLARSVAAACVKAVRPYYTEEILPVMRYIEHHRRPDDLLYLNDLAYPAFQFYSDYDPARPLSKMQFVQGTSHRLMFQNHHTATSLYAPGAADHLIMQSCFQGLSRLPGHHRIWFLFARDTFHDAEYALPLLDRIGKQQDHILEPGATAYLYALDADRHPGF